MALSSILDWLNPAKRRAKEATASLTANAEKALAMKTKAQGEELAQRPHSQTAGEGMNAHGNEDQPPSGALDHGGQRVAVSRSTGPR